MNDQRVTFACAGCGEHHFREVLKVADGCVYCARCYPASLPAQGVKVPHVRGPKPEWRKR